MQEETFEPQPASEKLPNEPVSLWPGADISVAAGTAVATLPPRFYPEAEFDATLVADSKPEAPSCVSGIRMREPHGTRPRGLYCEHCGAQSAGEPLVCKRA